MYVGNQRENYKKILFCFKSRRFFLTAYLLKNFPQYKNISKFSSLTSSFQKNEYTCLNDHDYGSGGDNDDDDDYDNHSGHHDMMMMMLRFGDDDVDDNGW